MEKKFDVIIAANGKGMRAGTDKLAAFHGESTVLGRTVEVFKNTDGIDKIILVSDAGVYFDGVVKVNGGGTRAESVKAGLSYAKSEYVLIHDGARPFVTRDLIKKIMEETLSFGSAIPYVKITDSLRKLNGDKVETVNREDYIALQTPQGFRREEIATAYEKADKNDLLFDESELYSKYVSPAHYVPGEEKNKKITSPLDVFGYNMKVGSGFDVHKFADNGKPLVLGGVCVPYNMGLEAHSDGDVVIHAVMDALLSAANERDIGVLFPDSDERYKDIDSAYLLGEVKNILDGKNVKINNISVTIIAQAPKLAGYVPLMQKRLAEILSLSQEKINITATTTENLGIVGEKKAIAVLALCSAY